MNVQGCDRQTWHSTGGLIGDRGGGRTYRHIYLAPYPLLDTSSYHLALSCVFRKVEQLHTSPQLQNTAATSLA